MAGAISRVYQNIFRRTSTFILAAVGGAFMFERGFDLLTEGIYDNINQGKLWKHVKHRYGQASLEDEEEE
ncbi:hypothetical protein O3P69_019418 [Scylla paramamosain]|uniref:Complex III subunit 9 n=1 Tax=Scylla paramamosain TaxID=85552 RepID=A0AAW0SWL8_SCYPA